jgi:hypothetical protein
MPTKISLSKCYRYKTKVSKSDLVFFYCRPSSGTCLCGHDSIVVVYVGCGTSSQLVCIRSGHEKYVDCRGSHDAANVGYFSN